jgi:hypothetical protein
LPGKDDGNPIHGGFLVSSITLSTEEWAEQQFGECQFGDERRTRRAVRYATQVVNNSSGSTPSQTLGAWSDCKAAYRLINREEVIHEALQEPHWRQTRARTAEDWLLLGDTTEVEYGIRRKIKGLGPTGNGSGRGFFVHSSWMIGADSEEVVGLAGQEIFYRQPKPRKESRERRLLRKRESEVWGRVIDKVGPPPEGTRFTHVFDRGADNFEVYCRLLMNRGDWVVRASQLNRRVLGPTGNMVYLRNHLDTLPESGRYRLTVRQQKDQPARTAEVGVRYGTVTLCAPRRQSPWVKANGITTIVMWVVEVYEINPPPGVAPMRWVLYTSHPVESFEDAWRVIGYYEKRTVIEEYHKVLKTGCQVEHRQYETSAALEAITGLLAIVAVRLLQLRSVARTDPQRPAEEVVPRSWVNVLQVVRRRPRQQWTVRQFFRELAGLGGFLGRKHDGEPGWLTIWRGFDKLVPALMLADGLKRCG